MSNFRKNGIKKIQQSVVSKEILDGMKESYRSEYLSLLAEAEARKTYPRSNALPYVVVRDLQHHVMSAFWFDLEEIRRNYAEFCCVLMQSGSRMKRRKETKAQIDMLLAEAQ